MNDPEQDGAGGGQAIRVAVVDDQELFRRGLTMLLAAEPGVQVVGEAGDGLEGTSLAATAAPEPPDDPPAMWARAWGLRDGPS